MTGAAAWSAVLVLLLTLMIARSTATAAWVPGIDPVVPVALAGAVLMGVLAVLPVPWPAGLVAGLLLGPLAALNASWPQLHAVHPGDPLSIGLAGAWWTRLNGGVIPGDPLGYGVSDDASLYLFLISLLMWVAGGWLSWCVLRWHRPLLGLVPGAAAFATNLLNSANQSGYTLVILGLTLALLLWTNYTTSVASVMRARVKLTGDARWDFWESGLVAMVGLIFLALLLPPLSTEDRTTQMQASAFSSWAALQQRLNNGGSRGPGIGPSTTGFSTEVSLGGSLKRSHAIVFTYTYPGQTGLTYFRGVNITGTSLEQWRYSDSPRYVTGVGSETVPQYSEKYQKLGLTTFTVNMLTPPGGGNQDILFYPGIFYMSDRDTLVSQVQPVADNKITTVDRLSSLKPPVSNGSYIMTTQYSFATEDDLNQAGTAYPDWLSNYRYPPAQGYRSAEVLGKIHQVALEVTTRANAQTPYQKASAIEAFLRTYKYTLTPQATPQGRDPIDFFLFTSREGYCEFFATAMGDMLRSLGIPTRLVNGFGPGQFDVLRHSYVVHEDDAHTWVESYFPGYGWITFEPTPDNFYSPVHRGAVGTPCVSEAQCNPQSTPGQTGNPTGHPTPTPKGPVLDPGNTRGGTGPGFTFRMPDALTLTKIAGIMLAFVLVLLAAAAHYLRPRSVTLAWKRTLALARMAGAERRPGETPLELARRIAGRFPEASDAMRLLADGFVVSAYAPPELAPSARASVLEAWAALRPLLLRRVASRLHLTRA
ncbi:MAG TPA: transglutaminase domain-containing protein [Candidatus Dormibacteraeota bacterium]|jgi:transglutaminase-like putative cysteine protease